MHAIITLLLHVLSPPKVNAQARRVRAHDVKPPTRNVQRVPRGDLDHSHGHPRQLRRQLPRIGHREPTGIVQGTRVRTRVSRHVGVVTRRHQRHSLASRHLREEVVIRVGVERGEGARGTQPGVDEVYTRRQIRYGGWGDALDNRFPFRVLQEIVLSKVEASRRAIPRTIPPLSRATIWSSTARRGTWVWSKKRRDTGGDRLEIISSRCARVMMDGRDRVDPGANISR